MRRQQHYDQPAELGYPQAVPNPSQGYGADFGPGPTSEKSHYPPGPPPGQQHYGGYPPQDHPPQQFLPHPGPGLPPGLGLSAVGGDRAQLMAGLSAKDREKAEFLENKIIRKREKKAAKKARKEAKKAARGYGGRSSTDSDSEGDLRRLRKVYGMK